MKRNDLLFAKGKHRKAAPEQENEVGGGGPETVISHPEAGSTGFETSTSLGSTVSQPAEEEEELATEE